MSAEPLLDTGHAFRVQKWTSRVLAIVCAVEAFALVGMGGAMLSLFPLKEVQPMLLIGGSRDDRVWRVEPFEVGTRGWDLIAQKMAENYIVKRETIDLQTEVERWQEVAWLSSDDVFREFKEWMSGTSPNSPFEMARKKRLTRTAVPQVTTQLNDHQIQVEFLRRDFQHGEEISRKVIVATLTFDFVEQAVATEDRYLNPTGWQVVAYGLAEKAQ